MLTPYAIVRPDAEPPAITDHAGRSLRAIEASALALLVGEPIDPAADAEGFMETVAAIHDHAPCVPVRLDDPLPDETAGRRLLETGADRFVRLLDRLDGADEWSVLVEPPPAEPASPRVPAAPDADDSTAAGGLSYLRRRRRDLDTAAGMHPAVSDLIAHLATTLAPAVRDTRTIATRNGAGSLALLVDRDLDIGAHFRAAAADATLPCTLSGPWPPFSFVSLTT
jgi:hypothetical protein